MTDALIKKPVEAIQQRMLDIRGQRVLLDTDLATIYGVETKPEVVAVCDRLNNFAFPLGALGKPHYILHQM